MQHKSYEIGHFRFLHIFTGTHKLHPVISKIGKILAVDDNEDILFALKLLLKNNVSSITTLKYPDQMITFMEKDDFDVILLDMNFTKDAISGQEGLDWLAKILEYDRDAVVVFLTAYGDTEKAVQAIKAGATDFILKPWQNEKLLATISSSIKLKQSRKETDTLRKKQTELSAELDQPFADFIGNSTEMQKVFTTIQKVADTDANVLILGENGTGKELVARALHRNSLRKDEVFISVDLGSISESLFESELFGYEKGAFTDAKKDKPGRIEIASDGTLFLDEIGNLSLPFQTKLLTVLERREVIRVGATKPKPINIRLICATNHNLHHLITENNFRQDLFYRINTVEIHLPPLRDRTIDIPLIANHYLKAYSKKYRKHIKGISTAAVKKLIQYDWPGNVRELQHAIERAIIMTESTIISPDDFMFASLNTKTNEIEHTTNNLDEVEKQIIRKVLKQFQGNISQAAQELGISRTSLYRRMEKYEL